MRSPNLGSVRRPSRSETLLRGAGCLSWARPDLREPRASDHPGPPDQCRREFGRHRGAYLSFGENSTSPRNGIRFSRNSFSGLAALGSLCA